MRLFGGSSSSSFSQMESYGGLRKCMAEGGGRRRRKICSDGAGGEGRGRREFYVAFSVFFFFLVGTETEGGLPRYIS